jgi:hypothetical protein
MNFCKLDFDLSLFLNKYKLSIEECNREEYEKIINLPKAQKRNSVYKKYVYIDEKVVYKGPYLFSDKKMFREIVCIIAHDLTSQHFDLPKTTVNIKKLLHHQEKYYICYDRVDNDGKSIKCNVVSNSNDRHLNVVDRYSQSLRVNDVEKQKSQDPEFLTQVLQHNYIRYILGCGDIGSHNLLMSSAASSNFFGCDFENVEGKKDYNCKMDCLDKKCLRKKQIYECYVNSISTFKKYLPTDLSSLLFELKFDVSQIETRIMLFNYFAPYE